MGQVADYPSRLQIKLQYGLLWALIIIAGGAVCAGLYVFNLGREVAHWISQ